MDEAVNMEVTNEKVRVEFALKRFGYFTLDLEELVVACTG
jgi:hypothetical protein